MADSDTRHTVRVVVAGATGWAGRAIAEGVLASAELSLVGAVARAAAGRDLGLAWSADPVGVTVVADVGDALTDADVLVDYTVPVAAKRHAMPSGTARELAERLATVTAHEYSLPVEQTLGHPEARGAQIAGTPVHSVRLPSFVVSTEVVFAQPDERLTIRHDAGATPTPYVAGTLLAVRAVPGIVGVVRGLDTLLLGFA